MGKSLSHDLILGSQPTIKSVDVGIGHNEVYIRVRSWGLQSEELAAPAPDQRNREAGMLHHSQRPDRQAAVSVHYTRVVTREWQIWRSSPCCSAPPIALASRSRTGHSGRVPWPEDFMSCCICGRMESPPDARNYVELRLAFPAHDGTMSQWLGAHASCLGNVTAPGFTVESPFD